MTAATDKKIESITALKNANKHLSDLFAHVAKADSVLGNCASDLQRVAAQVGDIQVEYWVGGNRVVASLKVYLNTIATNLNGARS